MTADIDEGRPLAMLRAEQIGFRNGEKDHHWTPPFILLATSSVDVLQIHREIAKCNPVEIKPEAGRGAIFALPAFRSARPV